MMMMKWESGRLQQRQGGEAPHLVDRCMLWFLLHRVNHRCLCRPYHLRRCHCHCCPRFHRCRRHHRSQPPTAPHLVDCCMFWLLLLHRVNHRCLRRLYHLRRFHCRCCPRCRRCHRRCHHRSQPPTAPI